MSADVPDYRVWDRLAMERAEELTMLQALAAKVWPPSMQITVAPESRTVNAGEQAKINYALVNADLIKVTSKVEGETTVNDIDLATLSQPGGSLTVAPSKTVEYTFLVGAAGGCYSETVKITVNAVVVPPPPPPPPPTPPPAGTPSVDGTQAVAPEGSLVDPSGATWTFGTGGQTGGWKLLKNGVEQTGSAYLFAVLGGQLYCQNILANWFKWDGAAWVATANPIVNVDMPIPAAADAVKAFDFGLAAGPAAAGYLLVSEATNYAADPGYGFTPTLPAGNSRDRGAMSGTKAVNDLQRDFVFGDDLTFQVDLPNGNYSVTILQGDGSYSHGPTFVFLQGVKVGGMMYKVGEWITRKYLATVADGKLLLRLANTLKPIASPAAIINALVITPVPASA